jgi:poly(hydroxyalkanoate) depolymerase family esterase
MFSSDFLRLMKEAARLTQSGEFTAATAAVREAMGGGRAFEAAQSHDATSPIIDVDAHVVPESGSFAGGASWDQSSFKSADPHPASNGDAPSGEQFVAGRYVAPIEAGAAPASGRRDYKLFVPPHAGTKSLPLIVMLHGCTQNPDDFAAGTAMNDAARKQGFYVLYAAQSQDANPQRCWNWFKHNHQQRDRGEPALLAGMTRDIAARYGIDPERIYVAGLSAGGAMAAILADTYPDLFAAVGVHSGLAAGIAGDLPQALSAMNGAYGMLRGTPNGVPAIVFQGDADTTVHPANAQHIIRASTGGHATAEEEHKHESPGRAYTKQTYRSADGTVLAEYWLVHGTAHAWSGGSAKGSYTDSQGPDAGSEMVRFFFAHPRRSTH